jgi:hypothetical protein
MNLVMVYLMILLVAQIIQHQMIGPLLVRNELERL